MKSPLLRHELPKVLSLGVACFAAILLWGCNGSDDNNSSSAPFDPSLAVQRATCGPNDKPETDLQGQVSAAQRTAGYKGNSCNLQLIGQSKGEGASWQHAWFQDKAGHLCNYYDTGSSTVSRQHLGVVVIDATNPASPTPTAYLDTTAMLDPWESLKVNERRQMLGGVNALNGNGGPEFELFDISGDCRHPQMLTGAQVGLDDGTGQFVAAVRGHEGNFAPDGLTYYAANLGAGYIYPIDISNPTKPKMLTQYFTAPGRVHGLNISDDGNRAYVASFGNGAPNPATVPGAPLTNGMIILDTSQIQARVPNPQVKVVSVIVWPDGGGAQHVINTVINNKNYAIQVDEAGSGGNSPAGWAAACAANMPAWQFARIIDISDETKPAIVSKLMLEAYDPKNCAKVMPDLTTFGNNSFTYGSHYCSVDNRKNATTLACGYFNSGIRVFDIRDPTKPREIAYYNPPSLTTGSLGSYHFIRAATGGWVAGGPDWCSAQVRLDVATASLQTTCQDQGIPVTEVHQRRVAFPDQHHASRAAELASPASFNRSQVPRPRR